MKTKLLILLILLSPMVLHAQESLFFTLLCDTTTTQTPPTEEGLFNGLLSVWELDETTGTTAYDAYSTQNGTITGDGVTLEQTGIVGTSFFFSGSDDYIDLGNSSYLQPTSEFTYSTWLYPQSVSGTHSFFARWYAGTSELQVLLRTNASAWNAYIYQSDNTQRGGAFSGVAVPNTSGWFHVVVIADGSVLKMYVNGTLSSTTYTYDGTLKTGQTTSLCLGAQNSSVNGITSEFVGYIDQSAYWDRALTATEVAELYNSGSGLPYTSW